jgi:hypothetical protein
MRRGFWLLDIREDFNAGEIGTKRGQTLELGSGRVNIGGNDDHATLNGRGVSSIGRSAIGHGGAGGDVSGELESEEATTCAVIAVEERDACQRETVVPEPANRLGTGLSERVLVNGKGDG